jgi:pimeloyl-ACP methyl ester carboxylesterase
MDRLSNLLGSLPTQSKYFVIGSSVATTLAVLTLTRLALYSVPPKVIRSPRRSLLPRLSKKEQEELPYPPDVFPGARDVVSPYGTIRVYEWGPEKGRKVLLVHGISTPCVALGGVANGLVEKGCRVILFDLWGRGYSDSVDLPHDSRLYATEILLAITSSPLSWTPEGFSLIGYSLGGGIVADFASSFPDMVKSLVLLAPAGLIRSYHFGWQARLMYTLSLPTGFVEWIVRRRLSPGAGGHSATQKPNSTPKTAEAAVNEEIRGARNAVFEAAQLSKTRPGVTVASAVQWQLEHHEGFVSSFVSSIKHSSLERTPETLGSWGKLGLRKDKVIVMAGKTDPLIMPSECAYSPLQPDSVLEIRSLVAI